MDEGEILSALLASRPEGDFCQRDLLAATTTALQRSLRRALDAEEEAVVARVVSRWFSGMCVARAMQLMEDDVPAASLDGASPPRGVER